MVSILNIHIYTYIHIFLFYIFSSKNRKIKKEKEKSLGFTSFLPLRYRSLSPRLPPPMKGGSPLRSRPRDPSEEREIRRNEFHFFKNYKNYKSKDFSWIYEGFESGSEGFDLRYGFGTKK